MGDRYSITNETLYNDTRRICVEPEDVPADMWEKWEARGLVSESRKKLTAKKIMGRLYNDLQRAVGTHNKSWEREQETYNDAPGVRG